MEFGEAVDRHALLDVIGERDEGRVELSLT